MRGRDREIHTREDIIFSVPRMLPLLPLMPRQSLDQPVAVKCIFFDQNDPMFFFIDLQVKFPGVTARPDPEDQLVLSRTITWQCPQRHKMCGHILCKMDR